MAFIILTYFQSVYFLQRFYHKWIFIFSMKLMTLYNGLCICLEKEMATHSSILAWEIPWTEEPGGLRSMGSQTVRHA